MNSPSGAAPTFNIFEFTGAVGVASHKHNSARYSVHMYSRYNFAFTRVWVCSAFLRECTPI